MKNITSVCALSFLLLAGCSKSPQENQQVESEAPADVSASSEGEPITLHARLDFMDAATSPSINAKHQLNASIYIEADVTREGNSYSFNSGESRVQGAVATSGALAMISGNDISSSETYNMHNEWNALTNATEEEFSIRVPQASLIGEGLSAGVEIKAPVSGTKKATVSNKSQIIDTEVTHSRSMFCSSLEADKDVCTLSFTIDAAPTKAQSPVHESLLESAKKVYAYQGKKNPEGGLIMYSDMVPVYGATTLYHNGYFVTELNQQYKLNVSGTDISQHIYLVVWSTKRGDKWQPEGLLPLKKLEELQ